MVWQLLDARLSPNLCCESRRCETPAATESRYVIASEVMPRRLRAASQGLLNSLGTGVGGTMAAVIGGVFVARNVGGKGGWRWVFYFQAILL